MNSNRNRKSRKSKSNKSRGSQRRSRTVEMKTLGGFADSVRVKLRYTDLYVGTTTAGAAVNQTMRGNGPYDPDATGTGGQPYNYDDWTIQYNYYRVWGSTIRVYPQSSSAASYLAQHFQMVLVPTNSSTNPSAATFPDFIAAPYSKLIVTNGTIGDTVYPHGYSHTMTTQKLFGYTHQQMLADNDLKSAYNTIPVNQWYWHVAFADLDGATSVPLYFRIVIDYDVEFFERATQTIDLLLRQKEYINRKLQIYQSPSKSIDAQSIEMRTLRKGEINDSKDSQDRGEKDGDLMNGVVVVEVDDDRSTDSKQQQVPHKHLESHNGLPGGSLNRPGPGLVTPSNKQPLRVNTRSSC